MILSDAHVHLDGFGDDSLGGVIQRARETGLKAILTTGMDYESSVRGVSIANRIDMVYAAIGIHPWNVTTPMSKETYKSFRELAGTSEKIVAVSEIGLDFLRGNGANTKREQMETFRDFIRLAREVGLPVMVHSRDSHDELIDILKNERATEIGGAIHGFNADEKNAREALDIGFYIIAGRNLMNPEFASVWEVMKVIPLERLLVETDTAPGYSSTPGAEKIEPASVKNVTARLAELKGLTIEEVAQATTANLAHLLRLDLK